MTTELFPVITQTTWTRELLEQLRNQENAIKRQIREAEAALGLGRVHSEPFNAEDERVISHALAEQIYAAYPKKQARGSGLAAIRKAMKKVSGLELLKHVQEYSSAVATWPAGERQFVPMCSSFMNQERWADDRKEWRRGSPASFEPQIRGV